MLKQRSKKHLYETNSGIKGYCKINKILQKKRKNDTAYGARLYVHFTTFNCKNSITDNYQIIKGFFQFHKDIFTNRKKPPSAESNSSSFQFPICSTRQGGILFSQPILQLLLITFQKPSHTCSIPTNPLQPPTSPRPNNQ